MKLRIAKYTASKDWRNKYDFVLDFSEGLAVARRTVKGKEKWGFVNRKGKVVIALKYESANSFSEGLAAVMLNGKEGFINHKDEVVIPLKYDNVGGFREGLAIVGLNGKYGFVNLKGEKVVPLKYDWVWNFKEGLGKVELNGKCGLVNLKGEVVIALKYDDVWDFEEGLAVVELNSKWGLINKEGKEVLPIVFSEDKIDRYRNDPLKWIKTIKGLYETDPEGLMQTLNVYEKDYDWEGWYNGI